MRILYLEATPEDAEQVRQEVTRGGHQVDVSPTLADARRRLSGREPYDLVLADLHVPDGSGLELVSEVRARRLPLACVVLTAHGDEKTAVAALKSGADDYQCKRVGFPSKLTRTLEAALARYRRDSEQRAGMLRVLYAEHHAADVELTIRHLAEHAPHIRCDCVFSSNDVLDRLPRDGDAYCPYDVLLLDYRLPGENALDLLKTLRTDRGLTVPVVVVTGQGDEEVATQTLRLGATDYLVKHAHYLFQLPVALESAHYQAALIRERDMLRASEARLRESEALLSLAGRTAQLGGWIYDPVTRTVQWSEEVCRIYDVPPGHRPTIEEALAYCTPESRALAAQALQACLESGIPFDEEVEVVTARGRCLWVRGLGTAVADSSGEVVRVEGALQDISEMKASHDALRRLAARLANILESITDAFITVDADWRITYLNGAAERVLQQSRETLLGRDIWLAFPQLVGTSIEAGARVAMAERRAYPFDDLHTSEGRWLEVRAYPSDAGLAVYFRDITARHEGERRLKQQASLLDEARDAILVRDLSHRITLWNRGATKLYGWTAEEAIGRSAKELCNRDSPAFDAAMQALLTTGEWSGELPQVDREGRAIVVEGRWTLRRDEQGEPQAVLAFNRDITERKRMEARFLRAQRMESLGTLAGGIAHDLNNVLAPIMLSIELLRMHESDAGRLALIATVEASAKRGADMVSQVLTFARGLEGRRVDIEPSTLVRDLQKFANETFLKAIEVRTVTSPDLWHLTGDPTQLHQLLLNLCVNARDAMPTGGTLTLTARNVVLDEQYVVLEPEASAGPYVCIEVADTGTGIPEDIIDRVFEPFFTTKEIGKGTGLGLSTSLAIVKSHGGFMRVTSAPGEGARFTICLPANTAEADPVEAVESARSLPRGEGELILVVDDEAPVRDITRRTLEAFGYRVALAADGAEAVRYLAMRPDGVAAVLIDMMMPMMDGPAAIEALRQLRPDLPLIAASGLGARGRAGATPPGVALFLHKPYSAETLLAALARVLQR